jgi:hypothetical protein
VSKTTVVSKNRGPGSKWWIPVLLALVVVAILAIAYLKSHPHPFGSSATSTPRPTATLSATATSKPGPTGTPAPGPTGTPATSSTSSASPGPSGTQQPGAASSPSPSGLVTGHISHTQTQIRLIQQRANQGNPAYLFYLDPVQVVQHNLSAYGYQTGQVSVLSPAASPTATPYTSQQGLPQVRVTVRYQGKAYAVYLTQPVQQGPKGIWVIITIRACPSGSSTC